MLVRCGRCRVELEVAGAGEFLCPQCGTRNMVRGAADAPPSPYDLYDLGGGLGGTSPMAPMGPPMTSPPPRGPAADETPGDVQWVRCPTCAYRFAVGDVEEVPCPMCSTTLRVENPDGSPERRAGEPARGGER